MRIFLSLLASRNTLAISLLSELMYNKVNLVCTRTLTVSVVTITTINAFSAIKKISLNYENFHAMRPIEPWMISFFLICIRLNILHMLVSNLNVKHCSIELGLIITRYYSHVLLKIYQKAFILKSNVISYVCICRFQNLLLIYVHTYVRGVLLKWCFDIWQNKCAKRSTSNNVEQAWEVREKFLIICIISFVHTIVHD